MNLQKLGLKGLIYTMIGGSIAGGFTGLINQTHGYQGENGKNSQTVKGYQEYKGLKAFWGAFVPAVEKAARQKGITGNEMMKQVKGLLEGFLKQSNITQEQTRNGTILLAFAQDYLDAAGGSSSNNQNTNTNNQVDDNLIRQREESIKKQREEEQNKLREQDYNKERNKDKIDNGFDFNKNQDKKDEFDYEKMTEIKYVDKSNVLKGILSNIRNDSNKFLIKGSFEDFVDAYKDYKGMSETQAINAADEAFRTIYSYVKVGDVEGTLKGYITLRDTYNIQRSRSEGGWQGASATWVHGNGACQGKLSLSYLMLLMAGQDNMKMWFKNVGTDHVQLKIEGYSKYFDAVGGTRFDTWRHIGEAVSQEHYSANNDNQSSNQNTNTTNNNSSSQGQDVSENNNNGDISGGSYEGVNEFDFS